MRVLIAEDDPVSLCMLQQHLSMWGYEVVAASDGDQAWNVMQRDDSPHLAIIDWIMPGLDGVEVCARVRRLQKSVRPYLVVLTRKTQTGDLLKAFDAGADDYVTKPFQLDELRARLSAGKRIVDLQERLVDAHDQLQKRAARDSLTGLWSRDEIQQILYHELNRASRGGSSVGVVLIDVDCFKYINDTHGHAVGDAVLRETSWRMLGAIRPYDSLGRYGGDEFLLVAPGADGDSCAALAERLRASVADKPMQTVPVIVTVSMGAVCIDRGYLTAEEAIALADQAMYRAKHAGRNRVEACAARCA